MSESVPMTPEEAKAVELAWESRGGVGPVPASEAASLLREIRERVRGIEATGYRIGAASLAEGRRAPRGSQRLALLLVVVVVCLVAIGIALWSRF